MATRFQQPPCTAAEPVIDIVHGIEIADPYRWLEDQNSARTRQWIEEQSRYTRTYFDAIPCRNRIRQRVVDLLGTEVVSEPWRVCHREFYLRRRGNEQQPTLTMRDLASDKEISLITPGQADADERAVRLSIINIKSDASLLAYGTRRTGADCQSVGFLDVNRMQVLSDRLPIGFGPGLVFSSSANGFYYTHAIPDSPRSNRCVLWHRLGNPSRHDSEIFLADYSCHHLSLFSSPNTDVLGYAALKSNDPLTIDVYLHDVEQRPRRLLQDETTISSMAFDGRVLFALTTFQASNRRIVIIDPQHADRRNWIELVPESPDRIADFVLAGEVICVKYSAGLSNRLKLFRKNGSPLQTIECPRMGQVHVFRRHVESAQIFYEYSSLTQPATIFCHDTVHGDSKVWFQSRHAINLSQVYAEQISYQSADGVSVPMLVFSGRESSHRTPRPGFLTAYGGFGSSSIPQFTAFYALLLECGILLAIALVRGGGELGVDWHQAGRRYNRKRSINDFTAAAEWLFKANYVQPRKLAIGGASNGGLLVLAALTQRPDLFRTALCIGPLSDMLRYHYFDSADRWIEEYGEAGNPEDFPHLLAYSPYHNVKDGVKYPSVLIVSGDADTRCNAMHARKMVARLQSASSMERALIDYKLIWGHTPAQPLIGRVNAITDRLAFIFHELGVEGVNQ